MHKKHQRVTKNLNPELFDVVLFTDGACKGNPGPGGWGVSIQVRDKKTGELVELDAQYGGDRETTNNQMELCAVIAGLRYAWEHRSLPQKCNVLIVTDSQYVLQGATEWINGWIKRGWIKSDKKPVANSPFWRELSAAIEPFETVTWMWVRGHTGHPGNERADQLANQGVQEA